MNKQVDPRHGDSGISRRAFLKAGALTGAAFVLPPHLLRGVFAASQPAIAAVTMTQIPLAPGIIPQFANQLPIPEIIPAGTAQITLAMREFDAYMLPTGTFAPGIRPTTKVWGYIVGENPPSAPRETYLGPVIVTKRGTPTQIKFVNQLGHTDDSQLSAYTRSTDQTLHWADPLNNGANMWNHMAMPPAPGSEGASNYSGPIPAVAHLHGGEVPPQLDGGPDAWVTSDGAHTGHSFYSKDGSAATNYHTYRYPNTQEAAPIWFHDHTLGATRLNVYAGLAGGYLITDPTNDPKKLPALIPLIVQDRMFDSTGQLFFTAGLAGDDLWALNPEHPYWNPEFVGNVICVNGKAWPNLDVKRQRYTFLFLNGSNARTYEMALTDPVSKNPGPPLWVISTDGGYLDAAVKIDPLATKPNPTALVMMPGERYQVIVDFAGYQAGVKGPNGLQYSGKWLLKNTAKTPFPAGEAPNGTTTGRIMQFTVKGAATADASYNPAASAKVRPTPMVRLVNPTTGAVATGVTIHKRRQLTLNEVMGMPQTTINPLHGEESEYEGGPLEILVNNTKWGGERITGVTGGMYDFEPIPGFVADATGHNYVSELPTEGETELWEIINLTADAHPIHLHLVQFQLMNRQTIDVAKYNAAYAAAFPGGGYDAMTKLPYPKGVYIPGWGPPLNYNTGNSKALGGNPDINALVKTTKGTRSFYLQGSLRLPLPQEAGWKDTIVAYPGQVTRIVVRWAPTHLAANTPPAQATFPFEPDGGHGYVWHCHIIDHEDNEMMRPTLIKPQAANRTYVKGEDY